eukprot:5583672-Amphidinium_carterae.1
MYRDTFTFVLKFTSGFVAASRLANQDVYDHRVNVPGSNEPTTDLPWPSLLKRHHTGETLRAVGTAVLTLKTLGHGQ